MDRRLWNFNVGTEEAIRGLQVLAFRKGVTTTARRSHNIDRERVWTLTVVYSVHYTVVCATK
jgi:hypothetical protein